jgi:hypothetical protein
MFVAYYDPQSHKKGNNLHPAAGKFTLLLKESRVVAQNNTLLFLLQLTNSIVKL